MATRKEKNVLFFYPAAEKIKKCRFTLSQKKIKN
jgi:hypothetical protein